MQIMKTTTTKAMEHPHLLDAQLIMCHVSPVSTDTHNSNRSGCTSSGCCNNHAGLSFANFNNGTLSLDASDTDVSGLDDTAMIDDIMAAFIDEESIADLPGDIRAELLYDIEPTNEYGWIPEGYECSGRVIRNISLPNFLWLVQGWSAVNETTTYPSTTAMGADRDSLHKPITTPRCQLE